MKNVAFFFSAIATQRLKKQRGKKKAIEDHEDSDDIGECDEDSQLAGSSSQDWLANHTGRKNGFTLYLHSAKVLQTYLFSRANM